VTRLELTVARDDCDYLQPLRDGKQLASAVAGSTEPTPSVRWALAGLSLSMLLSSLGTSIANVGLPTLAQAFNAPFQQVQWVVLAYLLAITTLIVRSDGSVTSPAADGCYWLESSCSR
jgi:hypothetical protein